MNIADELLLIFKQNADTLIKQTQTRPQVTLENELTKSMDNSSINPPLELEEEKITIDVTNLQVYFSVSKLTEHNNIILQSIHLDTGNFLILVKI